MRGFLTPQGNALEALEFIEETFDEMAFFIGGPIDRMAGDTSWVLLDVGDGVEVFGDESAQTIRIVGGVGNHMADAVEPFEQVARLRTIAPLPRRDEDTDRQPQGIYGGMYFGGQAAFGSPDPASFKPPF